MPEAWLGLAWPSGLVDRIAGDPLLGYALAAAAVLAVASLLGGWARGDARALTRPAPWVAAALAALAGLALAAAGDRVEATVAGAWPLHGLRRLPLYLVALGYGPTTGVLAALLFAATERTQGPVPAAEAVLALEMAVVGWLALAPSPRRARWAAPFGALVGWAMATATAGLAALAWLHRPLPAEVVAAAWLHDLPGVLAAAAILALPSPGWWRRAVPGAARGMTPGPADAGGPAPDDGERVIPPLRRERVHRRPSRLTAARLPRALRSSRRGRRRPTPPRLPEAPMARAEAPAVPPDTTEGTAGDGLPGAPPPERGGDET